MTQRNEVRPPLKEQRYEGCRKEIRMFTFELIEIEPLHIADLVILETSGVGTMFFNTNAMFCSYAMFAWCIVAA